MIEIFLEMSSSSFERLPLVWVPVSDLAVVSSYARMLNECQMWTMHEVLRLNGGQK